MSTLHYIFDPLCGWCYAATPLIDGALGVPGVKLALHAGGMLIGPSRRTITPEWRDFMVAHDQRIAQLSGQPFGPAYFDGLLCECDVVLDSEAPSTAILAAECLSGRGMEMLRAVQSAYFVDGRRIFEMATLRRLAGDLGFDPMQFEAVSARLLGMPTKRHIRDSRQLLERVDGLGFPTLIIESVEGVLSLVDLGIWLGRPAAFRCALVDRLSATPDPDTSCNGIV
jgi:putative protein-disulfide isomerase